MHHALVQSIPLGADILVSLRSTSVNVILGDIGGLTEDMMVPYSRNVYSASAPSSTTTYWVTELVSILLHYWPVVLLKL